MDLSNEEKWKRLTKIIVEKPECCDLIFSFFVGAVNSLRTDSSVRPFPPNYLKDFGKSKEKDIIGLKKTCEKIPMIFDIIEDPMKIKDEDCVDFLYWLFTSCDPMNLEMIKYSQVLSEAASLTSLNNQRPRYVYSVKYPENVENNWVKRKGTRRSFLAFHGSKLENFYSIHRIGLQQIFSTATEPLFGEGIYLSTDLQVSILFAPYGNGWQFSELGQKMSIVALCEVIDDPSKVKRDSLKPDRRDQSNRQRTGGYIIVKDSDLVRVKYFFVYTKKVTKSVIYEIFDLYSDVFLIAFLIVLLLCVFLMQDVLVNFIFDIISSDKNCLFSFCV